MDQSKAVSTAPKLALALLRWILDYHERTGYMPTIREMAKGFRMRSNNGPRYYLAILEDRGYLVRSGGLARTLRITRAGQAAARP